VHLGKTRLNKTRSTIERRLLKNDAIFIFKALDPNQRAFIEFYGNLYSMMENTLRHVIQGGESF